MDRPIDAATRLRRRRRRFAVGFGGAALAALLLALLAGLLRPSLPRAELRTARVDRGPVEATLTASGTVLPEHEQVVVSPIDSRVLRILKTPGAALAAGEPIVEIDVGQARLTLAKLDDQIALKRNERQRLELDNANQIVGLQGREEIKALEVQALEFEAARNQQYFERGLFSRDEVRHAQDAAERARIELREVRREVAHAQEAVKARLAGSDLELGMLEKERAEAAHQLGLATAASDRPGVLTWVVSSEGAAVTRGQQLARIADLSSYRVEATVSDAQAARVSAGQSVVVRAGDTRIEGRVTGVRPTVENGALVFDVSLSDPRHAALRHNLRVEVYLVTARVADALRVPRGLFLDDDGTPIVFVVRGRRAVRTPVEFGLRSFESYEVVAGLAEGDEVILSEMSQYRKAREVGLR